MESSNKYRSILADIPEGEVGRFNELIEFHYLKIQRRAVRLACIFLGFLVGIGVFYFFGSTLAGDSWDIFWHCPVCVSQARLDEAGSVIHFTFWFVTLSSMLVFYILGVFISRSESFTSSELGSISEAKNADSVSKAAEVAKNELLKEIGQRELTKHLKQKSMWHK